MTETPTSTTEPDTEQESPESEFKPITLASQAEADAFLGDAKKKARANEARKYPNYDEYKARAEASMTSEEKAQARIRELETALAERDTQFAEQVRAITRKAVAEAKDVPEETITGDTREEMEASADALLEWRGKGKPRGFVGVPAGGSGASTTVSAPANTADAQRQKMELAANMLRQLYGPGGAARR